MSSKLVFERVEDTTNNKQKGNIFDWCLDNAENFGAIPQEFVDSDEDENEITFNYDQMLSALTEQQVGQLEMAIDKYEEGPI